MGCKIVNSIMPSPYLPTRIISGLFVEPARTLYSSFLRRTVRQKSQRSQIITLSCDKPNYHTIM